MDNDIYFPLSYDESVLSDQLSTSIERQLESRMNHVNPDHNSLNRNKPKHKPSKHNSSPVREEFVVKKKSSCSDKWSVERILLCIIFVLVVCCIMQYITYQELNNEMNNLLHMIKFNAHQQHQQHQQHSNFNYGVHHSQLPPMPPLPTADTVMNSSHTSPITAVQSSQVAT